MGREYSEGGRDKGIYIEYCRGKHLGMWPLGKLRRG